MKLFPYVKREGTLDHAVTKSGNINTILGIFLLEKTKITVVHNGGYWDSKSNECKLYRSIKESLKLKLLISKRGNYKLGGIKPYANKHSRKRLS